MYQPQNGLDRPYPSLTVRVTSVAAPFQCEGEFCGIPFEFRARHYRWTLSHPQAPGIAGRGDPMDISFVVQLLETTAPWAIALRDCL